MVKKKDTQPVANGMVSGAGSRFFFEGAEPAFPATEWDQESLERFSLPHKQERLKSKVESLEKEMAAEIKRLEIELKALKTKNNPSARACILRRTVALVKERTPAKASEHLSIAHSVDRLLEKSNNELKDVCPKSWMKVTNPPRLLSRALVHPMLKARVKSFISKAR